MKNEHTTNIPNNAHSKKKSTQQTVNIPLDYVHIYDGNEKVCFKHSFTGSVALQCEFTRPKREARAHDNNKLSFAIAKHSHTHTKTLRWPYVGDANCFKAI